jgi:molecular chaperone GrpE
VQPMSSVKPVPTDSPKPESDGRDSTVEKDMTYHNDEEATRPQAAVEQPEGGETPFAQENAESIDQQVAQETAEKELQALREELELAHAQAAEYLEGWQRARAEFANYKRRVEAEREEIRHVSNEALLLKLLPVVDDFERAFRTVPEELTEVPWVNGMKMILRKLQAVLESENVTPIETAGQLFDPLLHEAVMQEESADYPDEHVMEEIQRGYRLGERVLRPAMVKVANNPNQSE